MDQSQTDRLRGNPILLVASLMCCFPVGLALIWTNKSWSNSRKGVWTGVWAAVMVVLVIVVSLQEAATRKSLDEADRLWASDQKAEAVAKYKEVIDGGVSSVDQSRRPTVFQRVVEYEVGQGNTSAAKQYLQKAETYNVALASDVPAVKNLLAEVKAEKQRAELERRASEPPSEEVTHELVAKKVRVGMTPLEVAGVLGKPDKEESKNTPAGPFVNMTYYPGTDKWVVLVFKDGRLVGASSPKGYIIEP